MSVSNPKKTPQKLHFPFQRIFWSKFETISTFHGVFRFNFYRAAARMALGLQPNSFQQIRLKRFFSFPETKRGGRFDPPTRRAETFHETIGRFGPLGRAKK